jgi:hypothetical protein
MFKLPLASPFHHFLLTGFHHPRLSEKNEKKCTPLAQRFSYFFGKQKGPPSKKDGRPVVPPSLADQSAHFTSIKAKAHNTISCNDEIFAKAYYLFRFQFGG